MDNNSPLTPQYAACRSHMCTIIKQRIKYNQQSIMSNSSYRSFSQRFVSQRFVQQQLKLFLRG